MSGRFSDVDRSSVRAWLDTDAPSEFDGAGVLRGFLEARGGGAEGALERGDVGGQAKGDGRASGLGLSDHAFGIELNAEVAAAFCDPLYAVGQGDLGIQSWGELPLEERSRLVRRQAGDADSGHGNLAEARLNRPSGHTRRHCGREEPSQN